MYLENLVPTGMKSDNIWPQLSPLEEFWVGLEVLKVLSMSCFVVSKNQLWEIKGIFSNKYVRTLGKTTCGEARERRSKQGGGWRKNHQGTRWGWDGVPAEPSAFKILYFIGKGVWCVMCTTDYVNHLLPPSVSVWSCQLKAELHEIGISAMLGVSCS